ncbi:MAG: hypothetical protein JXR10_09540 [Cyclobacteriaceae bacterium]
MKNKTAIKLLSSITAYLILMFGLGCDEKIIRNFLDLQGSLVSTLSLAITGL